MLNNQQDAQSGRQQGRIDRRGELYSVPYVEPLSDARTPLAVFFRILLEGKPCVRQQWIENMQMQYRLEQSIRLRYRVYPSV